jgi:putative ABC transport system permease protein
MAPGYEDPREIWKDLRKNSSLVVADKNILPSEIIPTLEKLDANIEDTIVVRTSAGTEVRLKLIGILEQYMVSQTRGIFTTYEFVQEHFLVRNTTLYFFDIKDDAKVGNISRDIEKTFIRNGMNCVVIEDVVEKQLEVENRILSLMQSYLGLGLMVGIAGLGVVTVRSVYERRREIGILRSVGFTRNMILKIYLGEILFIAIFGIVIGILLGIGTSYHIYLDYFKEKISFTVPWENLFVIGIICLVASLISTIPAAKKASDIPPADAVRYFE